MPSDNKTAAISILALLDKATGKYVAEIQKFFFEDMAWAGNYISCHRLTYMMRCIMANVLQTKARAQCDKRDQTKSTTLTTVDVF